MRNFLRGYDVIAIDPIKLVDNIGAFFGYSKAEDFCREANIEAYLEELNLDADIKE